MENNEPVKLYNMQSLSELDTPSVSLLSKQYTVWTEIYIASDRYVTVEEFLKIRAQTYGRELHKFTKIEVKVDLRLMAEVDLLLRMYGNFHLNNQNLSKKRFYWSWWQFSFLCLAFKYSLMVHYC